MTGSHMLKNQRAVDYALDVLEQFNGNIAEHSLTDLSKKLRINKNTVFRILTTLKAKQYLHRNDGTGLYRLGPKVVVLGQTYKKQMGLISKARPVLETLVNKCNETTFVAMQNNSHLVFLDAIEANHAVKVVPRLGVPFPLYCTAAGKVILANMSQADMFEYISTCELKRHTTNTIMNKVELKKQILDVSIQGYAIDNEEFDSGVSCIGVPLLDSESKFIGAISMSIPTMRFSRQRVEMEWIPMVKKLTKVFAYSHCMPINFLCDLTTEKIASTYHLGE